MPTRRSFLQSGLTAGAFVIAVDGPAQVRQVPDSKLPWYRRAYRWGQTNITEKDPVRYDIPWWREFWKKTEVQAVIINAGGIVAYYPSKFPLHHRAEFLNGRDLFGELTKAAHDDGLFVMARMDSNRTAEDFFKAHPDWFARNIKGEPIRAADKYVACINSPYYDEYLPDVLGEIIERSRPDGFTDNSWAGLGRESICYCDNCARRFREKAALALPKEANWDDPAYRKWILWSYDRRTEVWELNNRTTTAAGGPDCIWSGMMSGSMTSLARSFRDLRAVSKRAGILMLDHQRRDDDTGFQQNGDTGKRVHGMLGWDKLAPESMAMYQSGPGYLPCREQACARSSDVDDLGYRRRNSAVVALRCRLSRGSPDVQHAWARHAVGEAERAVSCRPPAGRNRWRFVVTAQYRLLRAERVRLTWSTRRTPDSCMHWFALEFLTCPFTSMIWRRPRAGVSSCFPISAVCPTSSALRFGNSQPAAGP